MKRRKFIKGSIIVLLAGVAAYLFIPSFKDAVSKMILTDIGSLKIRHKDVKTFISQASKEQFWSKFSFSKKMLMVIYTYTDFVRIIPYRNKYMQYRGQITGQFLLSTDFFTNRMDTIREVEYVEFYNPYKQPCSNPFSSIFYPEKV